ncbi:MAG: hypothetical protein ABIL06_26855 [Pseudomonadota bacterium]
MEDQAKNDLPADLQYDPAIQEVNLSDLPVIRVVPSGPLRLRRLQEFAEEMGDRLNDTLTRSRINGDESVTLTIQKRSGENIVRVTGEVKGIVHEMKRLFPLLFKLS